MGDMTETVVLGGTTYTIEHDVEEWAAMTRLGWLHGSRGALGCVTRDNRTGRILPVGLTAARRLSTEQITAALAPHFPA